MRNRHREGRVVLSSHLMSTSLLCAERRDRPYIVLIVANEIGVEACSLHSCRWPRAQFNERRPLEKNLETGGGEVLVVGERFGDAQAAHDGERDVIDNPRLTGVAARIGFPS